MKIKLFFVKGSRSVKWDATFNRREKNFDKFQ